MPGRIVVREGEELSKAIERFRHAVRHATRRQWSKTRLGCYEKPSDRRRRKEAVRKRNVRARAKGMVGDATVYLTLRGLLSPYEPFQRRRQPPPTNTQ